MTNSGDYAWGYHSFAGSKTHLPPPAPGGTDVSDHLPLIFSYMPKSKSRNRKIPPWVFKTTKYPALLQDCLDVSST